MGKILYYSFTLKCILSHKLFIYLIGQKTTCMYMRSTSFLLFYRAMLNVDDISLSMDQMFINIKLCVFFIYINQ